MADQFYQVMKLETLKHLIEEGLIAARGEMEFQPMMALVDSQVLKIRVLMLHQVIQGLQEPLCLR